uniref:Uncharacterized protein n=1 Tax=Syphacia muris TaxID=451379 RepID=A0A0N5AE98_9BILA
MIFSGCRCRNVCLDNHPASVLRESIKNSKSFIQNFLAPVMTCSMPLIIVVIETTIIFSLVAISSVGIEIYGQWPCNIRKCQVRSGDRKKIRGRTC